MSRFREFNSVSMKYGDKFVYGIRMTCEKCGHWDDHPRGSSKTFVGPAEESKRFQQMFERAGWFVGKRPQEDRCPACAKQLGIERPAAPTPPKNPVMEAKMKAAIAADEHAREQPRPMSREDGRLIFAKLEEVYRDERHGYRSGWSDHKVATDMGVPRVWVEDVRKRFFGPEGGNDEARQIVAEARGYLEEAKKVLDQAKAVVASAAALGNKGEIIEQKIARIEKVMGS